MACCKFLNPIVLGKGDGIFSHQSLWHTEVVAVSEPVAVKDQPTANENSCYPGSNHWSPDLRPTPHSSETWVLPPTSCTPLIVGCFMHVCMYLSLLSLHIPILTNFCCNIVAPPRVEWAQLAPCFLCLVTGFTYCRDILISINCRVKSVIQNRHLELEESIKCQSSIALQQIHLYLEWNIINKVCGKNPQTKNEPNTKSCQVEEGLRNLRRSWWK